MYGKEVQEGRASGRDHRRKSEGRRNIPGNRKRQINTHLPQSIQSP